MVHYTERTVLYQGRISRFLRAYDSSRHRPVVLKTLTAEGDADEDWAVLTRERAFLSSMDGPFIARPLGLERVAGRPALVFEDEGGTLLAQVLTGRPASWTRAVTWTLNVVDVLQDIHAAWVVHRAITPESLLWCASSDSLCLVDAAIAVTRDPGMPYAAEDEADRLVGVLPYMAPEQTGRTGEPLDHRSDLYSLGATLFQIVTGRPPFESADPLEIIHAHLARPAPLASSLVPEVPSTLSAIIAKLMAKDPRDRYQSAFGLKVDLEAVLTLPWRTEVGSRGTVGAGAGAGAAVFVPGRADPPADLRPPAVLHGREAEAQTLRAALTRTRQGSFEFVLVGGESGCGKTRLVRMLEETAAEAGDRFVSVKLDPSARAMPFHPIRAVLDRLVADILAQSPETVAAFRARLPNRLGESAALAVDLVPSLALILSRPALGAPIPPQEAQARSLLVLRDVLHALVAHGQALVVFLDDLQWVDTASLHTLAAFAKDGEIHNLLVVGAFRDNEVGPDHPLTACLAALEAAPAALTTLSLERLTPRAVAAVVADCLHMAPEDVADLADACWAKTLGNPFFLTQFLHSLIRESRLVFNQRRGHWQWSPEAVAMASAAETVIDLMTERLHRLPPAARRVLIMSACADSAVDLETLAAICDLPLADVCAALSLAFDAGLVIPSGQADSSLARPSVDRPGTVFRFIHDRVQEAALSLMAEAERPAGHLRIGRVLRDRAPDDGPDERLFQLMYHFQRASDLLVDAEERVAVAALALRASHKAAATGGFGPLYACAAFGLSLLPEDPWTHAYDLTLALHEQAVFGAYITHRQDVVDGLIQAVLDNARQPLDQTRTVETQVFLANAGGGLSQAIDIGLAFLARFGVDFPRHPTEADIGAGLGAVQDLLAGRPIESLADLPQMTDPTAHAFMRITNALAGPTFNSEPALFLCMVFRQVEWFIRHGNSAEASVGYSTFAMALCVVARRYEDGQAFGALSLTLADRYQATHLKGRIHLNVYLFVHHWRHHLRETFAPLNEGYRLARSHGDLYYASLNAMVYCHYLLWSGTPLSEVEATMADRHRVIQDELGQREQALWTRMFQQTVRNLRADSADPVLFCGTVFDEATVAEELKHSSDKTFVCLFHFLKVILAVMFRDRATFARHVDRAAAMMVAVNGIMIVPVFHFFACIGRAHQLAADPPPASEERAAVLQAMRGHLAEMAHWADHAPMNFAHKHAAMAALVAAAEGEPEPAARLLDQAISGARQADYWWDVAVCQELAGDLAASRGLEDLAGLYLRAAAETYGEWGARAKVADLRRRHAARLAEARGGLSAGAGPGASASAGGGEAADGGLWDLTHRDLDLATVLKASQAIGAEIVLDRLLDRMMVTVLENAGAGRGLLLRVEPDGALRVWAEKRLWPADESADPPARPQPDGPVTEGMAPLGLIAHTLTTGKRVIHPATEAGGGPDPYLDKAGVRSALGLPIRIRESVSAVLYLENRLTPNAFTDQRLKVLDLLAGQIAISLENALLYDQMEQRVVERTRELQEKNAVIERLASTDALTGLYNRRFLDSVLKEEIERGNRYGHPVSMAVLDIDHFKRINDTCGHAGGDQVLQAVAGVMTRRIRATDTLARWGGEEFCLLMPETDVTGARLVLEDIRQEIADLRLPGMTRLLTVSAGVSSLEPEDTAESFFHRVDEALYFAKDQGRNQVRVNLRGAIT